MGGQRQLCQSCQMQYIHKTPDLAHSGNSNQEATFSFTLKKTLTSSSTYIRVVP